MSEPKEMTREEITRLRQLLDGEAPVVWTPWTMRRLLDAAEAALTPISGEWRVGSGVGLNVYGPATEEWPDGEPMFQCHTLKAAARVVTLVNRALKQPRLTLS